MYLFSLTMEARIGRKTVLITALLQTSVSMVTTRQRTKERAKGGMFPRGKRFCASQKDRLDT